jgi:hypothetical protein
MRSPGHKKVYSRISDKCAYLFLRQRGLHGPVLDFWWIDERGEQNSYLLIRRCKSHVELKNREILMQRSGTYMVFESVLFFSEFCQYSQVAACGTLYFSACLTSTTTHYNHLPIMYVLLCFSFSPTMHLFQFSCRSTTKHNFEQLPRIANPWQAVQGRSLPGCRAPQTEDRTCSACSRGANQHISQSQDCHKAISPFKADANNTRQNWLDTIEQCR